MISSLSDLRSYIQSVDLYQTRTYTYVKSRPVYVIGYSSNTIQILRDRIINAGIRDIGGYIYGNPQHKDLAAYIHAVVAWGDLRAFIRSNIRSYVDLMSFIRSQTTGYEDLGAAIKNWYKDYRNLAAVLNGFYELAAERNLPAYLNTVLPVDLQAIVNIISITNLPATIVGEWLHSYYDINALFLHIRQHSYVNLSATLYGSQEVNLSGLINVFQYRNLQASLIGGHFKMPKDLPALIGTIPYKLLTANIHGWDELNLPAYLKGVYGDTDIQAFINAVMPVDLHASIGGFIGIGVYKDLKAYLESYNYINLNAFISVISPVDLGALLNAVGVYKDLAAIIYPRVVYLRKFLSVPLMEYKDMHAIINTSCFASDYRDMAAYLHVFYKKDLRAVIFGGTPLNDNIVNLGAVINTAKYIVEDTYKLTFTPNTYFTKHTLNFSTNPSIFRIDTFRLIGGSYNSVDLSAFIVGEYIKVDLPATLTVDTMYNYNELAPNKNPKEHDIYMDMEGNKVVWSREIELSFDDGNEDAPFEYWYFGGDNKVYKKDRSRYWKLKAESYFTSDDDTKYKVRRKDLYNMSRFGTMDEAVRSLIEKVGYFSRADLNAVITVAMPPHRDLKASILSVPSVAYRIRDIRSHVLVNYTSISDLSGLLVVNQFSGTQDLTADISAIPYYVPPDGDNIEFNFTNGGYAPPDYDNIDYEFNL